MSDQAGKSVPVQRTVRQQLLRGLCFGVFVSVLALVVGRAMVDDTPSVQYLSVGENGRLMNSNGSKIMVSVSKAVDAEVTKLSVAGDTLGLTNLALSGQVFLAMPNTKVLVIDSMTGARQVRILDGQFIGQSGWVSMESVRK